MNDNRINPFFAPYATPHDTAPFDKIRLEDFEEAIMEGIKINTLQVPAFRKEELAKAALLLVEQVFSEPGAEERYQEWLAKRRGGEKS